MAELATIARPYAEAVFKAVDGDAARAAVAQLNALAVVAGDDRLLTFAGDPKVDDGQVFDLIAGTASPDGAALDDRVGNLLRVVVDNRRLAALPEIAVQFERLVNAGSGVARAVVESAFPIDDTALADVVALLERRFGCKLDARVEVRPELIGGIRVAVGDEVLDTSVRARLDQMKAALTAA